MDHCVRQTKSKSKLARSLLAGAMSILPVAPAFAQTWTGSTDNNWFTATNWAGGVAPNSSSAAAVIDVATNNPVILNASATVATLTLGSGDSLDQTGGLFIVDGGSIANGGDLELDSQLQVAGTDLTLSGAGTLTMNGGQIGGDGYGRTLFNESTIQGSGFIGSNSGALYQANLSLNNSGTIDANSSGNTLTLQQGGGTFVNTGLLEATNGGTLNLIAAAAMNDTGGNITAAGAGSTVLVNMDVQGGTLTTSGGGVMETGGSGAYLDGATNGAITISDGSTYTAGTSGLTRAVGTLDLGTSTGATLALSGQLQLAGGDLTFAGPGTVTMSGGQIGTDGYGRTLNNEVTIEGYGVIGSNSGALYQSSLSLNNSGTIDSNVSGQTLTLQQGGGTFINSNLLEATGGGILNLASATALNNAGGDITASGLNSTVMVNMEVQGGTLNTSGGGVIETGASGAFLDGGSANGAITLSNGSTYTTTTASGLTEADGTLNLGTGAGPGATLLLTEQLQLHNGDLTLAGPGTVMMSGNAQIGSDGYGRTLNNAVTIEGSGVIGSNSGALYQSSLSLNNSGTIDADLSGQTLTLQQGGTFTNSSLLEATNGGTLNLIAGSAMNDTGGNITASGAGSTVLVNMDVQGGTLTTSNGGVMETGTTGAYLDGATNGAITLSDGSTYTTTSTSGLTRAVGVLNLGTSAGATLVLASQLQLAGGDLTLAGPGTVTMSGSAQIGGDGYGRTLNNEVTIEGAGVIGSNLGALYQNGLSVNNTGTIDSNLTGQTLTLQQGGGTFTNTGLLEATGGGVLDLVASAPLANAGGNITATGSGSLVMVNMQVQGGTLNSSGGGLIETGNSGAYLNGATDGAITLSAGSTYDAGTNGLTQAVGTLDLGTDATLALTGQLRLNGGDLTLSGPGAVTMSGGAQIGGDGYGRTLNNDTTIEGSGLIGSNSGALYQNITVVNDAGGTLLANISGQTLTIAGTGGLTNNGVMQADAGATLNATQGFTNFAGGTLTGGAYKMYSGTIQINALGSTGGEILTNSANIVLNGATATLTDSAGLNALSNLSTNASGANLTVENGNAFVTAAAGPFTNNGSVQVGAGSTFNTVSDYDQSGGSSSTLVDGTLTPGSGAFALASGLLTGSGTVAADVTNTAGVVNPGDTIGTLHALAYDQGSAGTLEIQIASATSNDVLAVAGAVTLDGLLDPVLMGGFTPTLGESFTFLDYTSRSGVFSGIENDVFDGGRYMWSVTYNPTDAILTVEQGPGGGISAAPEPSTWALMFMGIGGLGLAMRRAKRKLGAGLKSASAT